MLTGSRIHRYALATAFMVAVAGLYSYLTPAKSLAQENSLLGGRVVSSSGQALAGVPIRARRANSSIAVTVYTNSRGEYSFPGWSDLSAGAHAVAIELPDFEAVTGQVTLSTEKTERLDFTLRSRQPSVTDANPSEIVAALPGTNDQKHLLIQCDNCHSLQFALQRGRTKDEWTEIVRRMAGERAVSRETPGTRAFGQKQYVEPLADYLASIRGPGSSDRLPFQLRPRPTDEASTRLVVTEYDIPRGGHRDLSIIRGDQRFVWPHDVLVDPKGPYAYYTDHFSFVLGRLDRRTGEVKEFSYSMRSGMGRESRIAGAAEGELRAGNPGGGAHDMAFDGEGHVVFGMDGGTFRFDPATEQFTSWPFGSNMFGIDPANKVWFLNKGLHALDTRTGDLKHYTVPPGTDDDTYDMETDRQGRSIMHLWRLGKIGVFDPRSDQFVTYQIPTPGSGPRRGELDAQGRLWTTLYWAGRIALFDPGSPQVKEFALFPGAQPYTPPFPSPYSLAVDNRNQTVWTNDFNSHRLYRLDIKTGQFTEFLMPAPYEIRDLTVDENADRPTMWIPVYRPPARIAKVQVASN